MNQQELRLGNAILVNGEIQIVTQLPLPENCNNENTKGILFDENKLIGCGFQSGSDKIPETLHYFIHKGDIAFYSDYHDEEDPFSSVLVYSDIGEDYDYLTICQHNLSFIHEFQNLMFCLTKEEVNIDFLFNKP